MPTRDELKAKGAIDGRKGRIMNISQTILVNLEVGFQKMSLREELYQGR